MNLSATQGSSATNTITASLVSGLSQPVSFSAVGVPSGASASFSQKTCSPTCSSLLTIETAASTPAGTYPITVTGIGGDVTKTTSFTLTVNLLTASPVVEPSAQLTLTWQDNSNNEDDFTIERKTGTNGAYSQIASVAANGTSYMDNSVTRGVTYCYRVQAINSAGTSAYTNEACKTVL
jgi:hypothetical protein